MAVVVVGLVKEVVVKTVVLVVIVEVEVMIVAVEVWSWIRSSWSFGSLEVIVKVTVVVYWIC